MPQPKPRGQTFLDQLKFALEHFDQPAHLGTESPLAAPYFLGTALDTAALTATGRGETLCAAITACMESMWGGPLPGRGTQILAQASGNDATSDQYACLILDLNYFKAHYSPAPRTQAEIYHDILHISRPTHDRHLRAALERLAALLLQRLRPIVHAEVAIAPPVLVGRDTALSTIHDALMARHSVGLAGPGGIGKTSLAASISDRWPSPAVFWYTFRPLLNDQVESLLFAVAHFLHKHGASTLWHQLVADGGQIKDLGMTVGLAIADLDVLPYAPLLCFDEMDFLRPLTSDQPNPRHVQILELLESLRGHAAMLLIGQRAFWASDQIVNLEEWTVAQLETWLQIQGLTPQPEDTAQLLAYTAGNPRLAELCVAYYHTGAAESLADALAQLPHFHALLPLWLRLERRLPRAERIILEQLSVFRAHAPADVWQAGALAEREAFSQLIARKLVRVDAQGGVGLLPALQSVIYDELPAERQRELHAAAAEIRATRGEYTAAAFHYIAADQPETAVALWFPQRTAAIHRGEGAAARAIFAPIPPRHLSPRRAKELLLLRSELHALLGQPHQVIAELDSAEWRAGDPATPQAMLRIGQAHESQGSADIALDRYQAGLEAVHELLGTSAQLYVQRSLTYLRQRDMQNAWREANLAQFHSVTMLGIVHDQRGDYTTARDHYLSALALAETSDYPAGIAQTYHYLAMLHGRRLEMDRAQEYFEAAMRFYTQIGDRVQAEYVRGNLASAYIQARDFGAALGPASRALRFFQAMGNPFRTAQNASNLAEAHAELGQLDEAQHFAELVLNLEEPHSHPYALYTLGTVNRKRDDLARAQAYYDQCRQFAESNDDTYLLAFAVRALGEVYMDAHNLHSARDAFHQAEVLFLRLDIQEEVSQTRTLLAVCDASGANFEASTASRPA